jgi:hypothetical protein
VVLLEDHEVLADDHLTAELGADAVDEGADGFLSSFFSCHFFIGSNHFTTSNSPSRQVLSNQGSSGA